MRGVTAVNRIVERVTDARKVVKIHYELVYIKEVETPGLGSDRREVPHDGWRRNNDHEQDAVTTTPTYL
jgi:hypothetical protein